MLCHCLAENANFEDSKQDSENTPKFRHGFVRQSSVFFCARTPFSNGNHTKNVNKIKLMFPFDHSFSKAAATFLDNDDTVLKHTTDFCGGCRVGEKKSKERTSDKES